MKLAAVWTPVGLAAAPGGEGRPFPSTVAWFFHAGGRWWARSHRGLQLFSFEAGPSRWREVCPPGDFGHGPCVAMGERLVAVLSSTGRVCELTPTGWKQVAKGFRAFGNRSNFELGAEPATAEHGERLVVWGGQIDPSGRPSNDTFFFESGKWRKGGPSPLPYEKRGGGEYLLYALGWDGALERTVRFGPKGVAVLEGDRWERHVPPGYEALVNAQFAGMLPAFDASTGESLLIDVQVKQEWDPKRRYRRVPEGRFLRFSLSGCEAVGTFALPPEESDQEFFDAFPFPTVDYRYSYDAATRRLYAQAMKRIDLAFTLELGEAFEEARKRAPRGG